MSDDQNKAQSVLDLEEQLAGLQFKFNNLVEHAKRQDAEVAHLTSRLHQVTLYQDGLAWHWQGDGEDYPESLTCPVVIPANALRELMAKGCVMRELLTMPAPRSQLTEKAGHLQIVGRIHHNDAHPEPVRAALNTAGLALADDTKLYADTGTGSVPAIAAHRDAALDKAEQLAGLAAEGADILREAYNSGRLCPSLMRKVDDHFHSMRRSTGRNGH